MNDNIAASTRLAPEYFWKRGEKSMRQTEPTMFCASREVTACGKGAICTVLFEAATLLELGQQVSNWATTHTDYRVISFSHACDTRVEPGASLAGPRPRTVFTGVLLLYAPMP
jgi:hypothetical protein